jgi:hypothetical protein
MSGAPTPKEVIDTSVRQQADELQEWLADVYEQAVDWAFNPEGAETSDGDFNNDGLFLALPLSTRIV